MESRLHLGFVSFILYKPVSSRNLQHTEDTCNPRPIQSLKTSTLYLCQKPTHLPICKKPFLHPKAFQSRPARLQLFLRRLLWLLRLWGVQITVTIRQVYHIHVSIATGLLSLTRCIDNEILLWKGMHINTLYSTTILQVYIVYIYTPYINPAAQDQIPPPPPLP